MEKYAVQGRYNHEGKCGDFTGTFRIHDDGRVVGTMNDSGTALIFDEGKPRLIIGIKNENELNFWKISSNSKLKPLVYAMEIDREATHFYQGALIYGGKWVPIEIPLNSLIKGVEGNAGLREIDDAFKSSELEQTLDILGRIDKSRIQSYLDPNLIRDIKALSQETGNLSLTRVEPFNAEKAIF